MIKRDKTMKKIAAVHRESMRKNLQHRLEVARNLGDQKLVEQLEKEAHYLHLQ
jgi:hypothetical protein